MADEAVTSSVGLRCGGCGGEVENAPVGRPVTCPVCGGMLGLMTRDTALRYVNLNRMTSGHTDEARYFDLDILPGNGNEAQDSVKVYRVHGWYNPATKAVLQFG